MDRLAKIKKYEILYNLFPNVGDCHSVAKVLFETDYKSLQTLRTVAYRMRSRGYLSLEIHEDVVKRVR